MTLSTEAVVAGIRRALHNGTTLPAITSNPNFAALPQDQKKAVLTRLKDEMAKEDPSKAALVGTLLKGTLSGAAAGVPIAAAVPAIVSMTMEDGFGMKGLKGAMKAIANNKVLKGVVGTSMALSAGAGLVNSALALRAAQNARRETIAGLEDQSDEGIAGALFGAVGRPTAARQISVDSMSKVLGDISAPMITTTGRLGLHNELADAISTDAPVAALNEALDRGYRPDPKRMEELSNLAAKKYNHLANVQAMLADPASATQSGLDVDKAQYLAGEIAGEMETEGTRANMLADIAAKLRGLI